MTWNQMRHEVETHIEERALDLIESGLPERDAWAQARREFGNTTLVIERSREVWGWSWLENLGRDLRYAFRAMAANRLFTALAVASLALGIGANTAIYSFMESILLRSLPVKDPQSLAILKFQRPNPRAGSARGSWSDGRMRFHITSGGSFDGVYSAFPYAAFEIFEKRTDLFDGVFAYHGSEARITLNNGSVLGDMDYVSGGYFSTLGVQAALGRTLQPEDDRPGAPPVADVSLGLARQWFGDEHQALGKTVGVNGVNFTIIGVTPREFFGANPESSTSVYIPLHGYLSTQLPRYTENGRIFAEPATYWLDTIARLKPGVTRERAQAALDPVFAEYFRQASKNTPEKARMLVMDGAGGLDSLRHQYAQPLDVLMAMVALILIIACANIANLLLARASSRKRELAVRLSLGASRSRVIRQLLTESIVLSLMGALLGLLFAKWGVQTLTALLSMGRLNFTLRAELNWPVLAATALVSLVSAVTFGLAPAWQSTKLDVFSSLRASQSSPGNPPSKKWTRWMPINLGQALIVAQIALSFLLLMGAGLFVRTLSKLQSIELGFNPDNLLLFEINTQQAGYQHAATIAFNEHLRQRFATIPGVTSVSLAGEGQLDGGSWRLGFNVPGSLSTQKDEGATLMLPVGPDYLATMQIPLLEGRDIRLDDQSRTATAAVVSESFAKKHFGSIGAALGRHASMNFDGDHDIEIVGVAKDARYPDLKSPMPAMLYVDYRQYPGFTTVGTRLVLRTSGDLAQTTAAARQLLRQADPGVPMGMIYTQQMTIDSTIIQEILFARLCGAFAALALIIACVGLYGTTAYSVSRRTSEIGIRMALGAQRKTVLSMILREVALLGLTGLAIGIPIALAMSRLVESFLYNVQPRDPLTIAAAIATMLLGALLAAYIPAQRASRVDPMTALRHE